MKKILLIFLTLSLVFGFSLAQAQESTATTVSDIESSNPTILPTSPIYFLKTLGRNIQMTFTFDPVKKAELRLDFARQKLTEANKVVEKRPDDNNAIQKALDNYKKETEALLKAASTLKKDSDKAQKFLEKVTEQNFAQQQVLENIENKVQNKEKIQEVKEKVLENFMSTSFEVGSAEKVQEKLEQSLNKDQAEKKLEIMNKMQETSKEEVKKEMIKIQDNIVSTKLQNQELSQEEKQKLEQYMAQIREKPEYKEIFTEEFANKLLQENQQSLQGLNNISTEDMEKIKAYATEILIEENVDYQKAIEKFNTLDISLETKKIIDDTQSEFVNKLNNEDIACIEVENPVCGKDGKTYGNICKAKIANVEIAYKGACEETQIKEQTQIKLQEQTTNNKPATSNTSQ